MKYLSLLIFAFLLFGCPTPPPDEPEGEGFTPVVLSDTMKLNSKRDSLVYDPRFPASKYLDQLPELSVSRSYTLIRPESYRNWSECLAVNKYLKLLPGDYTGWGQIKTAVSGTEADPVIIRYADTSEVSAYKLRGTTKEAVIEAMKLEGVSNIIITGITFRGKGDSKNGVIGGMKSSILNCKNIYIDFCNIENVTVSAIRMINVTGCVIQNCVFQQFERALNGDGGAIAVQASRDRTSSGNRFVNNEIINFNDGMGFPREGNPTGSESDLVGECLDNVFENNDIYITDLLYNPDGTACAENSMDFKSGTKSNAHNLVIFNRFSGNRPSGPECGSSGSNGCFISLHRAASGIDFKSNIFYNGAVGFNILQSDNKFPGESMENLNISNNLFFDLNAGQSAGMIMANTAEISLCTVKGGQDGVFISNPKAETGSVIKNLFVAVKNVESELTAKNRYVTGIGYRDYTFYARRWTGPVQVTAKGVIK
jgi:hypothetical protein